MTKPNNSTTRSKLIKLTPIVFYASLLVFLYFYLKSIDIEKIRNINVSWGYMSIAVILGLFARYWGAFIWFVILKGLGATNLSKKFQLIYVYAKSWMGRYIPGTAPWILGKIYFASQHGISKNKLAVSSLLEGGLQVIVTMTMASLVLMLDSRLNVIEGGTRLLMAGIVLAGIITIFPPVFNRLISLAYNLFKKKNLDTEHLVNNKTVITAAGLYTINVIVNGLSLFYIALAVYPDIAYSDALFIIGAGSLAGAASLLAFFAPSGLGVREGIQLLLLSVIMPTEFALVVVVFTRIWSVIIDVAFWGLASLTKNLDRTSPAQ